MELVEMTLHAFGSRSVGIHVLDDDGLGVHAGPFGVDVAEVAWLDAHRGDARVAPGHAEHVR
jgi:hypothetical protein